jgi:D-3-phosphoglycerate dehydrogenase
MVFAVSRNILPCDPRTREGGTKDGLVGNEISGKTFGIVGYGAIGKAVAAAAKAFGCKVVAHTRSRAAGVTEDGVEFVTLDDLLRTSDVVSLHTPLTDETKRMMNADRIALMKPTAILINAARGACVDGAALADALNGGRIAGAGIDVFDVEPPLPLDEPLLTAKNAVLAPHVGFATKESMVKRARIVFDNISAWLDGKPVNVKV